jgi:toxin ParE1/3/4
MKHVWTVRLGHQAEQDYVEILQWTTTNFGEGQASTYAETIALAIAALEDGPNVLGARTRDDIQPGIRTLHVARQARAGRHFVVFRVTGAAIDILRLLHDSMDLPRHLPAANDRAS